MYDELESDAARYWYRRSWRPKKRHGGTGSGMKTRDHVQFGTPEDYIKEHVEDTLAPMGNITGVMMRKLTNVGIDTDVLDAVVTDIIQAKVSTMSQTQKASVLARSKKVARIYGVTAEEA